MLAQQLRDRLNTTAFSRGVHNSADLRELLRYAYKVRAELNAAINSAQAELAELADTPDDMRKALATLRARDNN